ncbi:uncharacterized protein LOC143869816 [Tasmannia lanceolata]|uniref:uncharacterized protein LOC143869816 n=1 Tax=Tasmannia lanceolata TaxID=3420 RepID=UPI004062EED9
MVDGTPVRDHMLKMMGFLNELDILGAIIDAETQVDIVLASLLGSFKEFVMTYHMNKLIMTLTELLNQLQATEDLLKTNNKSAFIAEGSVPSASKPKGKGKQKGKGQGSKKKALAVKNKKTFKKKSSKGNDACFHCGKPGHWKQNCRSYLASKQGDKLSQGMLQVFVVETNMIGPAFSWCVDTGATSHIRNVLQRFRISRRLTKGELILQVGTDATVAVQAVGDFHLVFSSGYLLLKDCLYVPSIRRNLISISKLISDGYSVNFNKNSVFIKKENYIIVEGTCSNGLYLINAKEIVSNIESIPRVDVPNLKRARNMVIPAQLWHLRLCHIGIERITSWNDAFLEEEFIQDASEMERIALEEQSDNLIERYEETKEESNEPTPTLRHSIREIKRPRRYLYLAEEINPNMEEMDPLNYREAMLDIDVSKWLDAMKSEMDSMYSNKVWTLVVPPEGIKLIGCKWIFKRKKGLDGKVETYKARLVAKGYTQKARIDYEETFLPVAMLKSIRILLAIAVHYDYEIWQMDIKTVFLNGNIQEDIYMVQPEGFDAAGEDNQKVCKLQRSIYGLKQASRSWNHRFDQVVKEFGFSQNIDEACVYKKFNVSVVTFLVLYVDDIVLIGNDVGMLSNTKLWLSSTFAMKDLG